MKLETSSERNSPINLCNYSEWRQVQSFWLDSSMLQWSWSVDWTHKIYYPSELDIKWRMCCCIETLTAARWPAVIDNPTANGIEPPFKSDLPASHAACTENTKIAVMRHSMITAKIRRRNVWGCNKAQWKLLTFKFIAHNAGVIKNRVTRSLAVARVRKTDKKLGGFLLFRTLNNFQCSSPWPVVTPSPSPVTPRPPTNWSGMAAYYRKKQSLQSLFF